MYRQIKIHSLVLTPALCLLVLPWLSLLVMTVSVAGDDNRLLLLPNIRELNEDSARLVEEARSAQAKATPFRIDVTIYRESLRSLMLSNREIAQEKYRIPQHILVNMVRMSALLHSAAECKTGRYIVCPAGLMSQLSSQQRLLSEELDHFKATLEGAD
jgi:hypothetical protein